MSLTPTFWHPTLWCLLLAAAALGPPAKAEPSGRPATGYVWSETSGWVDFAPEEGGVTVHLEYLSGFAWSENLGWIQLGSPGGGPYANTGADDWGVNRVGDALSGHAWSESVGWIHFDPSHAPVTLDSRTGRFDGYAWSPAVGWFHFRGIDPAYGPSIEILPLEVPTLSEWGLGVLALTMASLGVALLRT